MLLFTCTILKNAVSLIRMRHRFHKTGTCMQVPLELFTAEGEALQIFTDYRSLITARNGTRRNQENVKTTPACARNEGGVLTVSNAMSRYLTHEIFLPHNTARLARTELLRRRIHHKPVRRRSIPESRWLLPLQNRNFS